MEGEGDSEGLKGEGEGDSEGLKGEGEGDSEGLKGEGEGALDKISCRYSQGEVEALLCTQSRSFNLLCAN